MVVCKDLKAGILVSLQQQQKWGLVLDLPKMQATFTNIGKEVTLELHKTKDYRVEWKLGRPTSRPQPRAGMPLDTVEPIILTITTEDKNSPKDEIVLQYNPDGEEKLEKLTENHDKHDYVTVDVLQRY